MSGIVRIVIGVLLVVGAFLTKGKAEQAGEGATLMLYGIEMAPGMFWAILGVIVLIGVVMIGAGVKGLIKS